MIGTVRYLPAWTRVPYLSWPLRNTPAPELGARVHIRTSQHRLTGREERIFAYIFLVIEIKI